VAVRQALVGDAPVVETPCGCQAATSSSGCGRSATPSSATSLAIEVDNAGRLPVAIALAIRPYGPDGAGRIGRIVVGDGMVGVDGNLAVWLPKPPARLATAALTSGDASQLVFAGDAADGSAGRVECAAGFATAALVYPLPHGTSLRVLVPSGHAHDGPGPTAVPPHDAVARGWSSHLGRGARLELPDSQLAGALTAAASQLLLAAAGRELAGTTSTTETAAVVGALDRLGFEGEATSIVATLPRGQSPGGRLGGADPASDATSAALLTAGRHWRVGRDDTLVGELAGPLAAGGHHHTRGRGLRRGRVAPDSLADLGWRLRGILDVEAALRASQPDAAAALADLAERVRGELDEALDAPVRVDAHLVGALALVAPLGAVEATHPVVDAILEWVRAHAVHEGGVAQLAGATGMSPLLTSLVGRAEARRGDRSALDRLDWFVRTGGATRTWAELHHPRLGTGCGGDGWSPAASAAFVDLALDLLVHESRGGPGLVLCSVWPDEWLGAGLEVHGMHTTVGTVSFAIRWHGERPALLWEIDPHGGIDSITVTIPGLDPAWSSTDLRGEALLTAPTHLGASGSPEPVEGDSFA
jgi:hypothetical protein